MKTISLIFSVLITICFKTLMAQCPDGQIDLDIEISTDNYGYEGYWQLVPDGMACGTDVVWEGGNSLQVGCSGGGEQDATSGFGYGNNIIVTEEIGCVDTGDYDLHYIDDWGDGGFEFAIVVEELFPIYMFTGMGVGGVYDVNLMVPPAIDGAIMEISTLPYQSSGDIVIEGLLFNYGSDTINSLELTYTVNGSDPVTSLLVDLLLPPFTVKPFTHPVPWAPVMDGAYAIKVEIGLVNDQIDMNSINDTLSKIITFGPERLNLIGDYLDYIVDYEVIGNSGDGINSPTDLDFHPVLTDYQVWVINKGTEGTGGSTVTFWNAGLPSESSTYKKDENSWHFMSLPTAIAFSENTNFATAPGVKDANHSGGTFTGPTLWSSNMDIYAEPSGGNGSHLDMLHQSPYTMGICAEEDNGFYAFCDWHNHIHYYNFGEDHGPGNDDHSDGVVRRYTDFDVSMINDDLPCHLALDEDNLWLYIVDAGNGRILRMNSQSGDIVDDWNPVNEPLSESSSVINCIWEEIITEGLIEPVGIDVIGDYLLVSDHATGEIVIYDLASDPVIELKRIHTGRTGLMGITIGPDGLIWFVDQDQDELVRINITGIIGITSIKPYLDFTIYPNPVSEMINIVLDRQNYQNYQRVELINILGDVVKVLEVGNEFQYSLDVSEISSGPYFIRVVTNDNINAKKVHVQH